MPKSREKRTVPKGLMQELMRVYDIKTFSDIQHMVKDLTKDALQDALEAELDDTLGYAKHERSESEKTNSRNGYYPKTVKSESGDITLDIPRDRNGDHEPNIVKKHQQTISGIEEKVISMYARGSSTRDIQDLMHEMYGIEVSADMVSKITDKLLPKITAWQSRPLHDIYPILYLDALNLSIRHEGKTLKKAVYLALGVDLDGMKDVLGIWISENESAKFWMGILNELKNRGVSDILIACIDGLKGFPEAIETVFPKTRIQSCIVHQIRYSCRYVNYKDRKAFCADMRRIYTAPTEEAGFDALAKLDEKWGKQYAYAIKSWHDNWSKLTPFFEFSDDIRRLIYTTNPVESLNSCVKKVTQSKRLYPSDHAAIKAVFFAVQNRIQKWSVRFADWAPILSQLQIAFPDRLQQGGDMS